MKVPEGLIPVSFEIAHGEPGVVVRYCPRRDGATRWAVARDGAVLAKDGQWEFEPQPSNRDEEFFERCRYDSPESALASYWASVGQRPAKATVKTYFTFRAETPYQLLWAAKFVEGFSGDSKIISVSHLGKSEESGFRVIAVIEHSEKINADKIQLACDSGCGMASRIEILS